MINISLIKYFKYYKYLDLLVVIVDDVEALRRQKGTVSTRDLYILFANLSLNGVFDEVFNLSKE